MYEKYWIPIRATAADGSIQHEIPDIQDSLIVIKDFVATFAPDPSIFAICFKRKVVV